MTIEEAFGLVIRRLRKERNFSQEKLSISSSLGRAFISQLERGKQQPTLVTIFELASALNVSASRILAEIELLLKYNSARLQKLDQKLVYGNWISDQGEGMLSQCTDYGGNETILLVDDEIQLREMLSQLLREFGYHILLAEDGQEAVETFKNNMQSISMILMDVMMPRKDGVKAYKEILELQPDAQVVLMSAYAADCLGGVEKFNFIQKPMSPLELLKKIRHTLDS
ncbi:response regulator [Geobacter sp. SVR]|uniref:response regulator n=1 Tax=Geobacter sp. SVR TaxID=2495594 RepID=UPI00143EFECF|nr:response regulator [Geobacter sp. SVR]BCS54364.1 hypothetical protein GSVR_26720 [Geobacter sp. SVR]GCF87467.1 hypothetical protein GSbR_40670 [Geobacter sp. SVR]